MKIIISFLLFIFSLILIGQNLDKPFWGVHDWNGVRYGNIAKNYLRYGFAETKFGQVENSGPVKPDEFEYYTHYPPLLPIVISISYLIFGVSEFSTRLVPLLATTGIVLLIFFIGSQLYQLKIGAVAAFLALATPMVQYFGKNASHESLTLLFILIAFYGYLSIGKMKYAQIIFIAGLLLAQLTAWAGYFLLPALTLAHILRGELNQIKKLLPFWILSIALFSIHLFHVSILTGSPAGGNLLVSLLQRTGLLASAQPLGFNLPGYLNQLRLWFSTLYTLTLTILALLGIKNGWSIFTLGMVGVIYAILFSSSVFIHNYLLFYFLPFLAIAGALGIESLTKVKFFKRIYPVLIILILSVVLLERRNFLQALNEGTPDKFAVEVGKAINRQSRPDDLVLLSPLKFSYSADKFLRFYGDRKLLYSDDTRIEHDIRVIVDQDNGKFEIIRNE